MTKRVNKNQHNPWLGFQQVAAYTNQCTSLSDWSCGCSNEIPPFTGTQRISQFITVIIINITDWAMPHRPDKAATQTGGLQYYQAEIWKEKKAPFQGPSLKSLKSALQHHDRNQQILQFWWVLVACFVVLMPLTSSFLLYIHHSHFESLSWILIMPSAL